ncbi:DUF3873 domain-containing protein [Phocaeicola dorei]|nr:DUF3873 domain-containing protein [Phocaeicola dorei]QJR60688.1 DUF3873 domain-containing protein [Phocaeicola dorei]DAV04517.1 MAG TPA: hypothetical protein [Caudoviricetes sp.]
MCFFSTFVTENTPCLCFHCSYVRWLVKVGAFLLYGELFSYCAPTLDACREKRDKWLQSH